MKAWVSSFYLYVKGAMFAIAILFIAGLLFTVLGFIASITLAVLFVLSVVYYVLRRIRKK